MSDNERALLVADIKAAVVKELTGMDLRAAQKEQPKALQQLFQKYKEDLFNKFGTVTYHQIWESIRKLATHKTGKRYVRDLLPSEEVKAAEFAETLILSMLEKDESEELQEQFNKLSNRDIDADLLAELTMLGVKALPQIKALNNLTDEELSEYMSLYQEQLRITREYIQKSRR